MQFKNLALASLCSVAYAQTQNLSALIAGNSQLSSLASILGTNPVVFQQLSNAQNITLLAPSNNALAALLNTTAGQQLSTNVGALAAVLSYHVLQGAVQGSAITNQSVFVPTLLNNQTFSNVTGGQRVQAVRVNNNVTFFSGLLRNSTVTQANLNFTGGVVHVIDRVLTLPARVNTTLIEANLTALYGALNQTGLLSTLGNARDVTIFAPNNAAFQAIGSAANTLSVDQARSILQYHVVVSNGTAPYYSSNLRNGTQLVTLNGERINVRITSNGTFVNGARVVTPDVLVANGVVHVIDNVLNPANSTATSGPAFSGAASGTNVPFTSGVTATASQTIGGGAAATTTSSSTSSGAAAARMTGAVGAAALFGAGAAGAWAAAF